MLLSIKSESFITSFCQLFGFSPYCVMHPMELEALLPEQRSIPFCKSNSKKPKCSIWPQMRFENDITEIRSVFGKG